MKALSFLLVFNSSCWFKRSQHAVHSALHNSSMESRKNWHFCLPSLLHLHHLDNSFVHAQSCSMQMQHSWMLLANALEEGSNYVDHCCLFMNFWWASSRLLLRVDDEGPIMLSNTAERSCTVVSTYFLWQMRKWWYRLTSHGNVTKDLTWYPTLGTCLMQGLMD
jgi:hypothetical protein